MSYDHSTHFGEHQHFLEVAQINFYHRKPRSIFLLPIIQIGTSVEKQQKQIFKKSPVNPRTCEHNFTTIAMKFKTRAIKRTKM